MPKPLAAATQADYVKIIHAFGRLVGADRPLADFGPPDFEQYAKKFAGQKPLNLARAVAYLSAFFQWCKDEGLIATLPQYGRYFVRPPQQRLRDVRIQKEKRYKVRELRALWNSANDEEKLWMGLGLNGAMDNADLSHLTDEVIDFDKGVIDYRRRKTGKARRIIPLRPEVLAMLKTYSRHEPAEGFEDLFFVTATGQPLGRLKDSPTRIGLRNAIDAVARRWQKLMIRAGLRQKPKVLKSIGRGPKRRRRIEFAGDSDGRGFRSLRTTFANLVPVGYGDERAIIMGHLAGGVLVENYLEKFGMDRLRQVVDAVWEAALTLPLPPDEVDETASVERVSSVIPAEAK